MPLPSALRYAVEVVDTSSLTEDDWLGYRRRELAAAMSPP